MTTQPPSFTPQPRRRPQQPSPNSENPSEQSVHEEATQLPPPSYAPKRRSLRTPTTNSEAPAPLPPAFLPQSMRQNDDTPQVQAAGQATFPEDAYRHPRTSRPLGRTPLASSANRPANAQSAHRRRPQSPLPSPARPRPVARKQRGRIRRKVALGLVIILAVIIAWPIFLFTDAQRNLGRVEALSGAPDTPGTTYLLAGSDSRSDGPIHDDTEGQRADSVILLHVAPNGQTSAISLPRDTWVDIPDYGEDKLNASFALEGAPLLVRTVEGLTGLTIDHYVDIGMGGVANIVDAVGGVELCLDYDVDDKPSELVWTAGCHISDGRTALAFSRMRYSDPLGDIGRAERQRQVVTKTVKTALSPSVLIPPFSALALERAGARALHADVDTSAWDILSMVRAFRNAGNAGLTGTPPIESLNYETYSGSAVLLQDVTAPEFFARLRAGTLTPEDLN